MTTIFQLIFHNDDMPESIMNMRNMDSSLKNKSDEISFILHYIEFHLIIKVFQNKPRKKKMSPHFRKIS